MLSASEQFQLELINRARLDPAGQARRLGIDLNDGIEGEPISAAAKQPLAPNALLTEAARGHALWLLAENKFQREGEDGSNAGQRIEDIGYATSFAWTETIAWIGDPDQEIDLNAALGDAHEALFLQPEFRPRLLDADMREAGIAQEQGLFLNPEVTGVESEISVGMLVNNFAVTGTNVFLTGVAFDDRDGDRFYSIGEGRADVTFAAQTEITTTGEAGGYALALTASDNVTVTVSYGETSIQAIVDLSAGNVKLDLLNGTRLLSSGNLRLLDGVQEAALLGVGNRSLIGNDASNVLIGNAGNNFIIGGAGNDTLTGGRGNDTLIGGGGFNVALFSGPIDAYTRGFTEAGDYVVVDTREIVGNEGSNLLTNVQLLRFADVELPLYGVIEATDAARAVIAGGQVDGNVLTGLDGDGLNVVGVSGFGLLVGTPVAGQYGTLELQANGTFQYVANNAVRLPGGTTGADQFRFLVADPDGAAGAASLIVTVTGVNEPASISGDTTGTVIEGVPAATVAAGKLVVTDPDLGEDRFQAPEPVALATFWGGFDFDPLTGDWAFALDPAAEAVRGLDAGEFTWATLPVASLDGTASDTIRVRIEGAGIDGVDTVTLGGRISARDGTGLAETVVTFTPDDGPAKSTLSDATGRFSLELPPGAPGRIEAEGAWGAGSPAITTASALEALRLAVGLNPSWGPAGPLDYIAADINGDGRVTTADALDILRVAVGLETANPPRWIFVDPEALPGGINANNVVYDDGMSLAGLDAAFEADLTALLVGQVRGFT